MKELSLSGSGLLNVASLPTAADDTFTFEAGNVTISCSKFSAAFISPIVAKMLKEDPFFDRLTLSAVGFDDVSFYKILNGEKVNVFPENAQFFRELGEELNNSEIVAAAEEALVGEEQITTKNVLSCLQRKYAHGLDISNELSYAAGHASQIQRLDLVGLDPELLDSLISQPNLLIENEDWLIELVVDSVALHGKKAYFLFQNVAFEYISTGSMHNFIKKFDCEFLSSPVWNAICGRLVHDVAPSTLYVDRYFRDVPQNDQDEGEKKHVDFSGAPFQGIIKYLTDEAKSNPHVAGVIEVTASSRERCQPWMVLNYDWSSWFYTCNQPDSWIQIDFKNNQIAPSWYSIKTDGNQCSHIKSWVLEGTNDQAQWKELDRQVNQDTMNKDFVVGTFKCSKSRFFRYIRIRQIDQNTSGNYYLGLCNFEVFGDLKQAHA